MQFCIRVRLKPSNDRGEFELERAKSNNNIAENSVALGHETHKKYRKYNGSHDFKIKHINGVGLSILVSNPKETKILF